MKLTSEQLHILQHSLGVDQYGRGNQYRNYFATGPGCTDYTKCCELIEMGLMRNMGKMPMTSGLEYFEVTPKGIDTVAFESPRPPKVSRSRQRYLDYLEVGDCFENFRAYLGYLQDKKKGLV